MKRILISFVSGTFLFSSLAAAQQYSMYECRAQRDPGFIRLTYSLLFDKSFSQVRIKYSALMHGFQKTEPFKGQFCDGKPMPATVGKDGIIQFGCTSGGKEAGMFGYSTTHKVYVAAVNIGDAGLPIEADQGEEKGERVLKNKTLTLICEPIAAEYRNAFRL